MSDRNTHLLWRKPVESLLRPMKSVCVIVSPVVGGVRAFVVTTLTVGVITSTAELASRAHAADPRPKFNATWAFLAGESDSRAVFQVSRDCVMCTGVFFCYIEAWH